MLFPVQRLVIPKLISNLKSQLFRPGDVCVSAPTGSGKTLAFVLPIVQSLRNRVVPRVRALVVLPTQDLATQVKTKNYCLYFFDHVIYAQSSFCLRLTFLKVNFAQGQIFSRSTLLEVNFSQG